LLQIKYTHRINNSYLKADFENEYLFAEVIRVCWERSNPLHSTRL